jgi:predicted acetyltransferase
VTTEIRAPDEGDREALARVIGLSFNYEARPEDMTLAGTLCAFDDKRGVVGTATAVPFQQWFGGSKVACSGIASVAVLPEHRGSGIARAVMAELLRASRGAGEALSVLYPANSALYRKLGYEYAGVRSLHRAPVAEFPAGGGEVEELGNEDLSEIMSCFSDYARAHNGLVLSTDQDRWREHVLAHKDEGVHQRTVGIRGNGRLQGYASYFLERGEPLGYRLTCKHLVALGQGALFALLAHLRRFENSARDIGWYGPPSAAPVGLALSSSGFSLTTEQWRWMGRVVDVQAAIQARGYPPGAKAEAIISIDDPLFDENAGPWLLQVEAGRATASATGGTRERSLPIGVFSALYSGFVSPEDLVLVGALDRSEPNLEALSAMFSGPTPWMPDFF